MDPNSLLNLNKNDDAANNPGFTTLNVNGREGSFVTEERVALESRIRSGANWFFWVAGLSIVNSVIALMDWNWNFLAGLGMTQIIDGITQAIADESNQTARVLAIVLNVPVAGLFVIFGLQARKRHNWAFIIGMVLYALDGLIFLLVPDWFGLGFHVFALYCVFQGLRANNQLRELEEATPLANAKGA